ncbi:MAG: c-type cytochrome [Thermodesulfobacteriota bacterium]
MKRIGFLNLFVFFFFSIAALAVFSGGAVGASMEGKKIFLLSGCGDCHNVKGPPLSETLKTFAARKGPELWYAGSKFKEGFVERWLMDPRPIRTMKYNSLREKNPGNHPRLGPGEAAKVARYLMTLKSPDVRPSGIRPSINVLGRIVFIKKFACYGCHSVIVNGHAVGGISGPDLIGVPDRLNPDWIYAFLSDPRAFRPVSRMPVYKGLLSERDLRALSAYVAGLK